MLSKNYLSDTRMDTKKFFVSMKTNFTIRNYKDKDGMSLIYLVIGSGTDRERINLDISVLPELWDDQKKRIKEVNEKSKDINLILDNMKAKITNIKTVYRLSDKVITPKLLREELFEGMIRINFIAFFENELNSEKHEIKPGTYRRYTSVLTKLKNYKSEIFFNEINSAFFKDYKIYLRKLGNLSTTINSNLIAIKKYLRKAQKSGIKLNFHLDDIVAGKTTGNRTALNPEETKKIAKYYFSDFVNPDFKLTLGYFLFSCMTGLRLSNVMALERNDLVKEIEFVSVKSNKDQIISLNNKAAEIIKYHEELFDKKIHPNTMNEDLKKIMKLLGIKKKISFHVARHTFATNFLRMGGKIEKLQILMGHSKIDTTMVYVHILASEANEEIFLLDNMF